MKFTLASLIRYLSDEDMVYYHAPLDITPARVQVKRFTVDNANPAKSSITIWTKSTGVLRLKLMDHIDRFWLPLE